MASRGEDVVEPVQGSSLAAARAPIRVTGVGHAMYAAAVAGLGVLLVSSAFVYVWAPVPQGVTGRHVLASAAGALMLASAVGLAWRRTVVPSSAVVTALFLSWLLLLQVPRIVAAPSKETLWAGGGQLLTLVAGGWLLFASSASKAGGFPSARWDRLARSLYAGALPLFGLHHFLDAAGAAEAVPAWLPLRIGWAYLTGVAHVAAGVAILLGVVPRLAARLEAIMITAFVLLIHVPGVTHAPADPAQWTFLLVASAIGGAAWIVARSTRMTGT